METQFGRQDKQPLWKKMFGAAPAKGFTVYVCCQECAAKVKSDPGAYVLAIIADRTGRKK